jgi:hypothetical protein
MVSCISAGRDRVSFDTLNLLSISSTWRIFFISSEKETINPTTKRKGVGNESRREIEFKKIKIRDGGYQPQPQPRHPDGQRGWGGRRGRQQGPLDGLTTPSSSTRRAERKKEENKEKDGKGKKK